MNNEVLISYLALVGMSKKGQPLFQKKEFIVSHEVAAFLDEERKRENREKKRDEKYCLPFHLGDNEYHFSNHNKPHRHRRLIPQLAHRDEDDLKGIAAASHEEKIQQLSAIYAAMRDLSSSQRKRLALRYLQNLSITEIADIEQVHHSVVSRSIQAAIRNIVNKL